MLRDTEKQSEVSAVCSVQRKQEGINSFLVGSGDYYRVLLLACVQEILVYSWHMRQLIQIRIFSRDLCIHVRMHFLQEMADRYVSGLTDMNSDAFVSEFQGQRTLYWLRKVKAEKMEQLLKNIRPVAAPRSPRPSHPSANPPYLAPMQGNALHTSTSSHSLPASSYHQPPYPPNPHPGNSVYSMAPQPDTRRMSNPHPGHSVYSMVPQPDTRRMSNPAQPMPPYPQQAQRMPIPQGHPFPPAAFTGYPGVTQGYPPPRQPARPPQPYGIYR